ncbi:MAG TPA: purine-nucleoside phosphorylase [Bacteroidia bacterium]|nr:purine-nucleoside phosphorylase [Bacteroidia bacterium]
MDRFKEAVNYIRQHYTGQPQVGIVLGTGLGGLVNEIKVEKEIAYNFIPHFPVSTVESHFGKLIFGTIGDKHVVAMQGRLHYYEGYDMAEITFPIRVMRLLGIQSLYISNAAGGMNLSYQKGDLMIIDDHINMQAENPLAGPNVNEFGPRFPDMSRPYDPDLVARAVAIAKEEGIRAHVGIYVSVSGPNLETRAEYRFLRMIGADVVGMSTVPEVIVANHMGLRTFAISVVTDLCDPDHLEPANVPDIIETAIKAEPKLTRILSRMIQEDNS